MVYVFTDWFEVNPKIQIPLDFVLIFESLSLIFEFSLGIVFWSVLDHLKALGFTFGEKSR
jgi:hypothetical protein